MLGVYGLTAALVFLSIASLYDLKWREVPLTLFIIAFIVSTTIGVVESLAAGMTSTIVLAYGSLINGFVAGFTALLVKLGYIGEGDLAAYLLVWSATLLDPLAGSCMFTAVFTVMAYSVALQALLAVAIMVYNLAVGLKYLRRVPWRLRLVYMFTAIPVKAEKAVRMRGWWYPLTFCNTMLSSFDVREDAWRARERLRMDIEKGCIKPSDTVWVTYGIPAIPYIAVGLLITILLHDKIILLLLEAMGWAPRLCIG